MQNGGHLEKGAILDFQIATKLLEMIPVAFNTYKRTLRSFKSAMFIIFLGPTPTCRCSMAAILTSGRHLGFPNSQSCKFDLKASKNISRKCHACIIICTIGPLSSTLVMKIIVPSNHFKPYDIAMARFYSLEILT